MQLNNLKIAPNKEEYIPVLKTWKSYVNKISINLWKKFLFLIISSSYKKLSKYLKAKCKSIPLINLDKVLISIWSQQDP